MTFLYTSLAGSGCHRIPERSFFYRGTQFPVCARCTGVFLGHHSFAAGYIFSVLLGYELKCGAGPLLVAALLMAPMAADWVLQEYGGIGSTNFRRLVTGVLCGVSLAYISISVLMLIVRFIAS